MLIQFAPESTEGSVSSPYSAEGCDSQNAAGVNLIDTPAQRYDRAVELLGSGEPHRAFAELSAMANRGYPDASRIALMLTRRGTSLFGGVFSSTAQERASWRSRAE